MVFPAKMESIQVGGRLAVPSLSTAPPFSGKKLTGRRSNSNSHTDSCRNDGQMRMRGEGEEEEKGGREELEVDDGVC